MLDTNMGWLQAAINQGTRTVHGRAVTLTPMLAEELLKHNPDNRSINARRVEIYAADINGGRWANNGEPLIISSDGLLNDGQHRCRAVVAAGQSIDTFIIFGVDRETRQTTNQGKTKTSGDYLGMDGVRNAVVVAGSARLGVTFDKTGNVNAATRQTNAEIMSYARENAAALDEAAVFAMKHRERLKPMVSAVPLAFCYFVCNRVNPEAAEVYFAQVATGAMIGADDPAYIVRSRLLQLGRAGRDSKVEIILRGWCAFIRGQKRTMLKNLGTLPDIR